MPTLTEVIPCSAPVHTRPVESGPSTDLDLAILQAIAAGPSAGSPLRAITAAVGGRTHKVHARVTVLADRGLVVRIPLATGPRRGPGASVYTLSAQALSWTTPS